MSVQARCLLFSGDGRVELTSCLIPEPGAGEVLVETELSCISPGTELRVLAGKQADLGPGAYPLIPGYAVAGRVIQVGKNVPEEMLGRMVICAGTERASHRRGWGGHVSHAVTRAEAVIPIAESTSVSDAVLCQLAAISFRGFSLAKPLAGETVAVLGLGVLGQLSARLFAGAGARVLAGGTREEQVALARAAGIEAVQVERDSVKRLKKLLPDGARVVVDATGNPAALPLAVELAASKPWDDPEVGGARLVIQGSYAGELGFPHHEAFAKELTIYWPRYCHRNDAARVLESVEAGKLKVSDLLSEVALPENAAEVYHRLQQSRGALVSAAFRWSDRGIPPREQVERSPETTPTAQKTLAQRLAGLFGKGTG
jgi:bacteriochlorophyllide a dehydrogenase